MDHAAHLENPGLPFSPFDSSDDFGALATDMAVDSAHFRRDSINSCALSPASEHKFSFTSINPTAQFHPHDQTSSIMPAPGFFAHPTSRTDLGHYASVDDFDFGHQALVTGAMSIARRVSAPTPFPDVQSELSADSSTIRSPQSPDSNPDHMELASCLQQDIGMPRHMRPAARARCPGPSRSASDGIRKKNTRIDIPSDRNLHNIDELIDNADDEESLKELKAQRRLLRNREAALASRQRKKQHTEDLEQKEQRYVKQLTMLQNENHELRRTNHELTTSLQITHDRYTNACHTVNASALQREELVMAHTQETGRLRQQIQHLRAQLSNLAPRADSLDSDGQEGLGAFTSNMSALSVDPHALGIPLNQSGANSGASPVYAQFQNGQAQQESNIRPLKKDLDQPIASGILFMILLCGAFVASKANNNPSIPRLPEEVRAASTTVLDNLLQDPAADSFAATVGIQNLMVQPGHAAQRPNPWDHSMQSDGRPNLHRALTMPTTQQQADQLFSMTPAEYASFTSPEGYVDHAAQTAPAPRRNLAEALAGLRQESISKANPAEVYTRSLLWDQIPMDVVRQFKDLVKASKTAEQPVVSSASQHLKSELSDAQIWSYHMDTGGYNQDV